MKTRDYIAAVKAATAEGTDGAVARLLGVHKANVSAWQCGKALPDALACFAIAGALGIDPARVVMNVERERAERDGKAEHVQRWRLWIEKAARSGLAAMAVILSGSIADDAHAERAISTQGGAALLYASSAVDTLYIVALVHRSIRLCCLWITRRQRGSTVNRARRSMLNPARVRHAQ